MKKNLRFLGLDVHAETIAVAIAESDGEARSFRSGDLTPVWVRTWQRSKRHSSRSQRPNELSLCAQPLSRHFFAKGKKIF